MKQILTWPEKKGYEFGVTVSAYFEDGMTRTFVEYGPVISALELVLARFDALDLKYRVTAISTPQTIYTDLQENGRVTVAQKQVERSLLGRIGRLDIAPPTRNGAGDDEEQTTVQDPSNESEGERRQRTAAPSPPRENWRRRML